MRGPVIVTSPAASVTDCGWVVSAVVRHGLPGAPRTSTLNDSWTRGLGTRRKAESAGALREESFDEVLRNRLVDGDLVLAVRRIWAVLGHQIRVAIDLHAAARVFDNIDLLAPQASLLCPVFAVGGGNPVTAACRDPFNVLGDRQTGSGVLRRKSIPADFVGRPRIAAVKDRVVSLASALQPERIGE